jgi:hypothetical protein
LVGNLSDVEAQVELASNEIELGRQRQEALARDRDRLAVRAPTNGRLIELPLGNNAQVRRGDTIAVIERPRSRSIKAFLNQDDVLKVGLGDVADVFVPATGQQLKGRVVNVDRTAGFVREAENRQAPGYSWRGPTDLSAEVSIEVDGIADFQISADYQPGTPVTVVFSRRSTSAGLFSLSALSPEGSNR